MQSNKCADSFQASPTPSTASTVPIGRTVVLPSPSPFGEIEAEDVESLYKDCIHTGSCRIHLQDAEAENTSYLFHTFFAFLSHSYTKKCIFLSKRLR